MVPDMSRSKERKILKRQLKLNNILWKETKICSSEEPTKHLMFGNVGLANGLKEEKLLETCKQYGVIERIVSPRGKSYCFVSFQDIPSANKAYENLQGKTFQLGEESNPLYIIFTEKVPENEDVWRYDLRPPGLILLENFVTEDEEEVLLNCVNWNDVSGYTEQVLKHRKVKHYGFEFRYDINNVNKGCPLPETIPSACDIVLLRFKEKYQDRWIYPFDQLTVNQYLPGQGIPPHIDTHSAFEDPLLSLSLGSATVMEFKHPETQQMCLVVLPQRSLLVMSGEARFAWNHGITPRKTDIVPTSAGGLTVLRRGVRTSFTFRRVRRGDCDCRYHEFCDSYKKSKVSIDNVVRTLESQHVHQVYEEIADHFSETRHKPWPKVLEFVKSLPEGSLLLDVGCGNGKYFGFNKSIIEIGCDSSQMLSKVCKERGFQVFSCNCLALPVRSDTIDACICIAVIHHVATVARRLQALKEIVRVLNYGGRALIYVWAKDQQKQKKKSSYLKQNKKERHDESHENGSKEKNNKTSDDETDNKIKSAVYEDEDEESRLLPTQLPVHVNRTQFEHQDLLVPWKLKPQKCDNKSPDDTNVPTFYRYYHVFEDDELKNICKLIPECEVIDYYYEQGNWCVMLEKIERTV